MDWRKLTILSSVVGAVGGALLPAGIGNATHHRIDAFMTPPVKSAGQDAILTCGWHVACVSPYTAGIGLDWDDAAPVGGTVYFRGYFKVEGHGTQTNQLTVKLVDTESPFTCDRVYADIWENNPDNIPPGPADRFARMDYIHATDAWSGNGQFSLTTNSTGAWNNKVVGEMSDPDAGCAWSGTHVHESDVDVQSKTTTARNTA